MALGWVAALQVGVSERRVRVGSSSVEGSVTNVLPQLTKCRAERVRMAWYGVVTAINTVLRLTRVYRYLGNTWTWAGLGCSLRRGVRWWWLDAALCTLLMVLGEDKASPDLRPGAAQYSGMTPTEC